MLYFIKKSVKNIDSSMVMRTLLIINIIIFLLIYSCSSEPCEDLKSRSDSCLDELVKSLLLKVANNGDKQECKDYLDSYYFSFASRCEISLPDVVTDIASDSIEFDSALE